jgi:cytoskeletal protein RodZ
METLGHFLKSQREQSQLSQEDVAIQTRIPLIHIQSIEADQFDRLPHGVSAKGFLRLYARCVGASETTILRRFSEVAPASSAPAAESAEHKGGPSLPSSYLQVAPSTHRTSPLRIVLLVCVAVVLIGFGIQMMFFQTLEPTRSPEVESPVSVPEPPAVSEKAESPDSPDTTAEVGGEVDPSPAPATPESSVIAPPQETALPPTETASVPKKTAEAAPPSTSPLLLDIEAKEKTWVRIVIDGRETWDMTLAPKEKVSWAAKEEFRLTLGNAGGVSVRLNGKALAPLGARGKVVRDIRLVR